MPVFGRSVNIMYDGSNSPEDRERQERMEDQDRYSEYSFYPEESVKASAKKKRSGSRIFLNTLLVATMVIALGTTSLIGYTLLSGRYNISSTTTDKGNKMPASAGTTVQDTEVESVRTDLPTLTQLSTPDDALSIPEIVEKVSPSVVGISTTTPTGVAVGTGIIMSSDGYILTNAHVIENGTEITVVLSKTFDSEQIKAEVIGSDEQSDIAVLKIDKENLPAAEFGKSSELVVGEAAIVIGNPLGFELEGSVTAGIISALNRTLTIDDRELNLIQTDASVNHGNSGGPLINAYGQVVGITSVKIESTYGEGLGFAIPIDDAMVIVEDLMKYGYVKGRPSLGISGEDVTEIYSMYYGIPQGFIVRAVDEGSAAEKAGIKVNDIIIGINGQLITNISEFNKLKADFKAGDKISVSVYRDGERQDIDVILDEAHQG